LAGVRILFVWPNASWAVFDVARGLRIALARQGHDIKDFWLDSRMKYHARSISYLKFDPEQIEEEVRLEISRQASDTMVIEAMYHEADLVMIVSGLQIHPGGLWLVRQADIPIAMFLTESPYDDEAQSDLAALSNWVFTNDLLSAERHPDWHYLAHAIDPQLHQPGAVEADKACDVFMVSSAWPERRELLERVDWTGIDFRLFGFWPDVDEQSPLRPFVRDERMANEDAVRWYRSAKISINHHRHSEVAKSMNPRVREIVASGGFCISDPRQEISDLFGASIPTYRSAEELASQIRYFLAHPQVRADLIKRAQHGLNGDTFDDRAREVMRVIGSVHRRRHELQLLR
jgi:spore maturation protein CgeB